MSLNFPFCLDLLKSSDEGNNSKQDVSYQQHANTQPSLKQFFGLQSSTNEAGKEF
jgi:hypothetical protein